jgi:hypothetical protein
MVEQLKTQQIRIDILEKEPKRSNPFFETDKLLSAKLELRRMIYESDIEILKTQRIHLDNITELHWDYERKHRSFRKQENRDKYEQEVLDPHWELIEKEEQKLKQMIINL